MKLLTIKDVIFRIVAIVVAAEFLVMLVLRSIPHQASTFTEAVLDAVSLAILSAPPIYLWVIRPFVNARDEALAKVRHLAHVDPLTQLANRRLLVKHLEKVLAGSVRHKVYGAVLLMDLDGFKTINDRHGHLAGDAVLVEVAERLQTILRSEDIIGRMGGDEFIVLVQGLGVDERGAKAKVLRVAEKVISSVAESVYVDGKKLDVGASIGVRLLGFEERNAETVIGEADTAMYSAKQMGGGCVAFFGD